MVVTDNILIYVIKRLNFVLKVQSTYKISGFNEYEIVDKILYRKAYKTRSVSCVWQYRKRRIIARIFNNGIEGYKLEKNGKRKFYSLEHLRHKLIKIT